MVYSIVVQSYVNTSLVPHPPLATHSFLHPLQSPITLFQALYEMSWWLPRPLLQVPPSYLANSSFLMSRPEALKYSWKKGWREILLLCLSLTLNLQKHQTLHSPQSEDGPCFYHCSWFAVHERIRQTSHGLPVGTAFWIQATKLFWTSQQGPSVKLTNLSGSSENKLNNYCKTIPIL